MKRFFDILISSICLIIFGPAMLTIAIVVALKLGQPVLFLQQRPGLYGKPFTLIKFRTMDVQNREECNPDEDSERLSAFGRFLRSSSLDELPELINVLLGDMSLVGPRPLLMDYLELYTNEQARRHVVRPGITGWAQVNGRNEISWEKRFDLDLWYVDNHSFLLDLKILVLTVGKVLRREGVSQKGQATMTKFQGTAGVEKSETDDG